MSENIHFDLIDGLFFF